jgi:hypothetical protein
VSTAAWGKEKEKEPAKQDLYLAEEQEVVLGAIPRGLLHQERDGH